MEDNHYHTDKLAIFQQQQSLATDNFQVIEANCNLAPVAFIKEIYNHKKIRDRKTEPVFKLTVSVMLTKICALAGIKSEVDSFNADDINKMILTSCTDLTLEEVYKAFELERYCSYEDKTEHYSLFNADYVASVVKKYRKWKQDTKIQHNISPPQSLPEVTDSQKQEIVLKGIIRVFNEYKTTKELPEPCAYIFDELYERKIIKDAETAEQQMYYQKKFDAAKREVEIELKQENITSRTQLRTIKEELEKIANGDNNKVLLRCKKLILKDCFDKFIKNEVDIENLLE